jgi:flagellar biosynthesis regulator FlaF
MTIGATTIGAPTIGAMVERERRHVRRAELLSGVLLGVGAAALLLAAGAMLLGHARWLVLPRALPFAVWVLIGAALLALGARTQRRLRARASRRDVALAIETEQGMRRGLLVGAIELEGAGALAARAAQAARSTLPAGTALAPELRRASSRRALIGGGVAAAGALVLLSATPLFADGLRAVLRPIDAWRGSLLERPRIEGAPLDLVRGAPLHIVVRAPGRRRITLYTRQVGEAARTDTLTVDAHTGTAAWKLDALRGDLRLLASDGRATSDSVIVHAADRPFVGAVTLRVVYPSYLSRASESLPVGEPLRLPRGSTLAIAGRASVPLLAVALTSAAGESYSLAAASQSFTGRLVATHSVQLRWLARGPAGPITDVPPPLELEVLADSAPRVTIAIPTADTLMANDDRAELSLTATDDHGIGTVLLRTTRIVGRQDGESATQSVAADVGTNWSGAGSLDLAALRLAPGEMIRVRAEAVDASPWAQRGVSRDLIIKRPTMEERRDIARALGDSAVKEARAAAAAQKSLAQRTDEAARAQSRQGAQKSGDNAPSAGSAASPTKTMSFENAEKARSLAQEQRAMAERVEKLQQATKQLEEQLRAAGALDTSLARQLGEAQALLRQALTPEMLSQMQKLENAAKQLNGDQSRDALRDLAQMQQRLKEQLERSAEMLKRAAHEGAMQTLGDQAKELAQKQRALADSSARPDANGNDARDAAKLAEQTKRLREQMESLKDRLAKDKAEAGASSTERAGEHAARSETGMRRAANEMQKGASPTGEQREQREQREQGANGAQQARDAAGEMEQASKAMQDARAAQVKEWKKELTSELDQAVQEMMQLAREERALEQKARGGSPSGDQRGAQSAVEQGVDKAAERLQNAGRKSALLSPRSQRAVGEAREKVAQATQKVSQPNGSAAQQAGALSEAADALTKAAAALARDRERANSANSASGFGEMMKEMQEMAQKQGQINAQAQGLMAMPGGSPSAQSLARALAQKQRGVADQLEDAGDAAGGDRAAQLAREARQLADQLDGGRLDASTLARQQQLFRKLLDAGRSLEKEEREDSGKREAKSATGSDTFTPSGKAEGKAAARFRPPTWEELRGLSAEERRAILDYFTRLNSGSQR